MLDSDNVLLLRPVRAASTFPQDPLTNNFYGAEILYLRERVFDFADIFESRILPKLRDHASIVAYFVTCSHPNNFPALPVRADENVLVWFATFADRGSYDRYGAWLNQAFKTDFLPEMERDVRDTERRLLAPTSGSHLQ